MKNSAATPLGATEYVAVCDDGALVPTTLSQFLDNLHERGTPLSVQLHRDDIAFVTTADFAQRWTARESVIEYVTWFKARRFEEDALSVR